MSYEIAVDATPIGYVAHVIDHEGVGPRGYGKSEMSALVTLCINLADSGSGVYEYHDALLAVLRASAARINQDAHPPLSDDRFAAGYARAISDVEGIL